MRPLSNLDSSSQKFSGGKANLSTVWKKIEASNFRFYCVGCNRERRLSPPAKVGTTKFFFHILLTTAFLSVLTWPWLQFKGLGFFVIPVGLVFEGFYRMKMRAALVCPDCSFDPILYLVDRSKAVRQVEEKWRQKFEEKGIEFPEKKTAKHQRVTPKPAPPKEEPKAADVPESA